MTAWVDNVTVDCTDPEALAAFYAGLLGQEVVWRGGPYVVVAPARAGGPNLIFQRVPDPTPGKARIHLDVHVEDVDTATERALALGATRGDDVSELGLSWRVMRDPDGNPFCISAG